MAALLGLMASLPFNASAAWTFDYTSTPSPYTTVPSTPAGVDIYSDKLHFDDAQGNAYRRVYYPIGGTLTTFWRMDFEFQFSANASNRGYGHYIAVATSNTQDMVSTNIPMSTPSNNDLIGVEFNTPNAASTASANVAIRAKHGTVLAALSSGILVNPSTLYYITLERLSAGEIKLSVYSDLARTVHISGSPVCFTSFDAATGTGSSSLSYLQHGVISWAGLERTLTATVDNLTIDNLVTPTLTAVANQTLCAPGDVPNPLVATFSPSTFSNTPCQWQVFLSGFAWNNIIGATSLTYSPGSLTTTRQYRCAYTYGCSGTLYYSNTVTVTVNQFNPNIDCDITDDYSSSSAWTQSGTLVAVNLAGPYCGFYRTPNSATLQAVARHIVPVPDDKWRADFEFKYDALNTSQPNHYITALTSGSGTPASPAQAIIFAKVITSGSNIQVQGGSRSGFFGTAYTTPSAITISGGTTYYISLERLCSTKGRISVFSDAGRTTHVSGSPQYFATDASLTGLTYVQHANSTATTTGTLNATVDNLCIDEDYQFNGHREAAPAGETMLTETGAEPICVFPNPGTGVFTVSTAIKGVAQLEVYDVFGRMVQRAEIKEGERYALDLSGFTKGIYIVNLTNEGKVHTRKIVLQ